MRTWRYIYLVWALVCVFGGYRTVAHERTANALMGWPFIIGSFLFFCITPLAIVALRGRFGIENLFRRPSLDRSPFTRSDPLQAFRLFSVSSALISMGAAFALPTADHSGVMMFWASAAMSMGLFVGERLICLVYAKRVT